MVRQIKVGDVVIGGGAPVVIQSMLNTKTTDVEGSLAQIRQLKEAGCTSIVLDVGDGIVYYTTAGHVVMISEDATVVRDANGKIDPHNSYVTVIDQTPTWASGTNAEGQKYEYQANVDAKWSFDYLYRGSYLPFTFKEWTGEDPIEETEVSISHTGDTITIDQLYGVKVTSNYYIMDLYAEIYDSNGSEVFKLASRPIKDAGVKEFRFYKAGDNFDSWGSLDDLNPKKEYTVKIYMQLGTGERPTLWEGKLAQ